MDNDTVGALVGHHSHEGVEILTVRVASIYDAAVIHGLRQQLNRIVEDSGQTRFLLDLSVVRFMSAEALGALRGLRHLLLRKGAELKLAGIQPGVLEIFRISRLGGIYDICNTVASALEAFQATSAWAESMSCDVEL